MQTQIHKDSWMLSLGATPTPDLFHLEKSTNNVTVKDDFEKEKHSTKGISRLFVPAHDKKLMINEIMRMVKAGVEDRQHIYDQLIELDVLPKSGDKVMSPNSVWKHIQAARIEISYKPKTKIQQIVDMFDSGMSKEQIQAKYPGR